MIISHRIGRFLILFSIIFGVLPSSFGQKAEPAQKKNPIEKLSDTYYRIGSVFLEKAKREVYMNGSVNMNSGMIEVLACGRKGKLHESVLVLDVVPHDLQVALLLLGLDHTKVEYNTDGTQVTDGDEVEVLVSWENDGKQVSVRGAELLFNLQTEKVLKKARWIFIGSQLVDSTFMADIEESLITTYHDPNSIIDSASEGANNDDLLVANEALIPAIGTPVKVTLKVK